MTEFLEFFDKKRRTFPMFRSANRDNIKLLKKEAQDAAAE